MHKTLSCATLLVATLSFNKAWSQTDVARRAVVFYGSRVISFAVASAAAPLCGFRSNQWGRDLDENLRFDIHDIDDLPEDAKEALFKTLTETERKAVAWFHSEGREFCQKVRPALTDADPIAFGQKHAWP